MGMGLTTSQIVILGLAALVVVINVIVDIGGRAAREEWARQEVERSSAEHRGRRR